jgi:polygalacturonase
MECSNVVVQGLTILAPVRSPNTDGINPGNHVEIEFSSIGQK